MTLRSDALRVGVWVGVSLTVTGLLTCLNTVPAHAASSLGAGSGEHSAESSAWSWIRSQLGTGTVVTSPSVIEPDSLYDASWTGPVSGRFELIGVATPPVSAGSPVVLTEPTSISDDYRGVVRGHLDLPASSNRWIVNLVRATSSGVVQGGVQALASADGSFGLDLASASPSSTGAAGHWELQILDASRGYSQEGESWPHPGTFDDLVVRAVVVTDRAYVIGETSAKADGTFAFESSRPGAKVFQLVDSTTDTVLAEAAPDTGLVRSYDVDLEHSARGRTFGYDQALALITADSLGDSVTAARLTRGLLQLQTDGGPNDGGFVSSAAALNPAAALPEYRSGNQSVATYALLRHLRSLPPASGDRANVADAADRGVRWLLARQVHDGALSGLVTGGQGRTLADGSFDPETVMPWASTEHNLDAWHTLRLAGSVLADRATGAAAAAAAERLEAAIVDRLWDSNTQRFLQGWQPEGADPTPVLDVNSWGAIFLERTGRTGLARSSLDNVDAFATSDPPVSGYEPRTLGAPLVWFEGSAGVALAQARLGDHAAAGTLEALSSGQLSSGAFPEASRTDAEADMMASPAVAGTAWVILAQQALDGEPTIWDDPPSTMRSASP